MFERLKCLAWVGWYVWTRTDQQMESVWNSSLRGPPEILFKYLSKSNSWRLHASCSGFTASPRRTSIKVVQSN